MRLRELDAKFNVEEEDETVDPTEIVTDILDEILTSVTLQYE